MKRILLIFMLCLVFPVTVYAAEDELIEKSLSLSGIDELISLLPEQGQEYFSSGFDEKNTENLTLTGTFEFIVTLIKEKFFKPFKLFLSITGIIILSSLVFAMKEGVSKNTVFSAVISLSVSTVLASSVMECIENSSHSITDMSYFLLSFIPVFSGVTAASGKVASSIVYHSTVFGAVQLFSQGIVKIIIPLVGIFLAISIVGASLGVFNVDGLTKSLKTVSTWLLTFCMTVFVGLLTIKGVVSTSADTVSVKATKFVISTFIPIVGGALSEAYSSLSGCMSVVKSTVGVFGIVAIVISYMPMVIEIILVKASVSLSSSVGELFGRKEEVSILKSVSSVLSVLLSVILCYGLMITVSVTVILILSNGGS